MADNLKRVIYLSNTDYNTLISTGEVTVGGTTITYSDEDLYLTPESVATSNTDGLMSASDKSKLDGIAAGAQVNPSAFLKSASKANDTLTLTPNSGSAITVTYSDIGAASEGHTHTYSEVGAASAGHAHDTRYVRFDSLQSLSSEQQTTARSNIGAITNANVALAFDKTAASGGTDLTLITTNERYLINHSSGGSNYYHSTGSWNGLTYTATNNGGAPNLAFTLPVGETGSQVSRGDHTHNLTIDGLSHTTASNTYFRYALCETASGTAAKVAIFTDSNNSFTLATGAFVLVKFTAANGKANPTLELGTDTSHLSTAKSIKRYGTTAPSTNAASSWQPGAIVPLVYDGTNWIECSSWDNNSTYSGMITAYCSTAAGTAAKFGTCTNMKTPQPGTLMAIAFNAANTAGNVTLDVGSTGAKPLYFNGARAGGFPAGTYLGYYDGTNWYIRNDGKMPFLNDLEKDLNINGKLDVPTTIPSDQANYSLVLHAAGTATTAFQTNNTGIYVSGGYLYVPDVQLI